ncbi:unnamed protein product [Camellia sinensis]
MKKKKKEKKIQNKEEIAEDWCFVCKDGGLWWIASCLRLEPNSEGKTDDEEEATNNGQQYTTGKTRNTFIKHPHSGVWKL